MKRLASFVAGAVVVGALVGGGSGAGATTNQQVQVVFREDTHIRAGETCRWFQFSVPPLNDSLSSGIERIAQVLGVSSVFVVGTRIRPLTTTSGNYEVCLNAPAPAALNVETLIFGRLAP